MMSKDQKIEILDDEDIIESDFEEISEDEILDPEVIEDDQLDLETTLPTVNLQPATSAKASKKTSVAKLDPLTAYLNELKQYSEISRKEEHRLAVKFRKDGDPKAAYALVTANLTLVVKIAMTFKREWENMLDLVQEGNVGLMKAVQNFDPFRGVPLPAYASWWIKAYILKYLLDNWRLVKVGTTNTRRKLLYNLKKEKEKLEQQGFTPTTKLLAEKFGVDEQEVIDVETSLGASDVSMTAPLNNDDENSWAPSNFLTDGKHPGENVVNQLFQETLKDKISAFVSELEKPIEKEIFATRILSESPLSLKEIGDNYNITREAVRQTEQRLMKRLKVFLTENFPEAEEHYKNE
jgi:RNA polymerase sigma-32 factor